MRGWLLRYFGVFPLLCFVSMIPTLLSPNSCWGSESGEETVVFSLDIDNKPLGEVLKEIEKSTSYKISVDEKWENFPMTAKLQNVGVEEGLRRLLRGFNHALIVVDAEKSIFIDIRVPSSEQREVKPRDMEVIPSRIPGEKGTTLREIQAIKSRQKQTDPLDREVFPPKAPGQRGMTVREFKALEAQRQKQTDPLDRQIFPPKAPGQRGMTVRELKALEAKQKSKAPVFPFLTPPPVSQPKEDVGDGGE